MYLLRNRCKTSSFSRESLLLLTSALLATAFQPNVAELVAQSPLLVVGAAADIQYEDRIPGPHPDDIRRWYNTSNVRLDEIIQAWNSREDLDLVLHLGDLINAQWESYDVVLDYPDGTDYDPDLLTFRNLNVPSYQVLGNHEFYKIDDTPHPEGHDDFHVRERLGLANNIGYYELAPVEGYRFLILDDQVPEANPDRPEDSFGLGERRGSYFDQQMQWARRMVADAWRDGEKVVMYQHYPMAQYYNDKPLSEWQAEIASIIETFPNVVAHFSGHFHGGPGKVKDGVLYDTLAGTVSANPELDQNIWYELEFYDDHVVVDQFGENYYLVPDEDDKEFYFRDHTTQPVCEPNENCLAVNFSDFNGDGDFDQNDLAIWQANYGLQSEASLEQGDAEGDLDIDGSDFLVWQRKSGSGVSSFVALQAVPEPGTATLLSLMAAGLLTLPQRTRS